MTASYFYVDILVRWFRSIRIHPNDNVNLSHHFPSLSLSFFLHHLNICRNTTTWDRLRGKGIEHQENRLWLFWLLQKEKVSVLKQRAEISVKINFPSEWTKWNEIQIWGHWTRIWPSKFKKSFQSVVGLKFQHELYHLHWRSPEEINYDGQNSVFRIILKNRTQMYLRNLWKNEKLINHFRGRKWIFYFFF